MIVYLQKSVLKFPTFRLFQKNILILEDFKQRLEAMDESSDSDSSDKDEEYFAAKKAASDSNMTAPRESKVSSKLKPIDEKILTEIKESNVSVKKLSAYETLVKEVYEWTKSIFNEGTGYTKLPLHEIIYYSRDSSLKKVKRKKKNHLLLDYFFFFSFPYFVFSSFFPISY